MSVHLIKIISQNNLTDNKLCVLKDVIKTILIQNGWMGDVLSFQCLNSIFFFQSTHLLFNLQFSLLIFLLLLLTRKQNLGSDTHFLLDFWDKCGVSTAQTWAFHLYWTEYVANLLFHYLIFGCFSLAAVVKLSFHCIYHFPNSVFLHLSKGNSSFYSQIILYRTHDM